MQISQADQQGRVNQRRMIERLLEAAEHLQPAETAMVRAIYDRGMNCTEFARASGRSPSFVRRRLARLINRIKDPLFQFVIRESRHWPKRRATVAKAVVLHGRSQRETAEMLGLSLYEVRRQMQQIRVLRENSEIETKPRHVHC